MTMHNALLPENVDYVRVHVAFEKLKNLPVCLYFWTNKFTVHFTFNIIVQPLAER